MEMGSASFTKKHQQKNMHDKYFIPYLQHATVLHAFANGPLSLLQCNSQTRKVRGKK